MSAESDRFEKEVATVINSYNIPKLKAERPSVSTKYSDVKLTYNNNSSCWLEVKMNQTDNLGNTRVSYVNGNFVSCGVTISNGNAVCKAQTEKKPLADEICKHINNDKQVSDWIKELCKFYNDKYAHVLNTIEATPSNIILYTSTSNSFYKNILRNGIMITPQILVQFITEKHPGNQYIYKNSTYDVSAIVRKHYIEGKAEPAFFLQCGKDNMYRLYESDNQLNGQTRTIVNNFPELKKLPILRGTGIFNLRISFRGGNTVQSVRAYEIQPEVKITKYTVSSGKTLFSNDKKKNPLLQG